MFGVGSTRVRVFVCVEPTDMRCSFQGLSGKVRTLVKGDPLSGDLYCFVNRRGNYMKVLYWSHGGYCIWSKRLIKGSFTLPTGRELSLEELQQVVDGIDLRKVKKQRRFSLAA